MSASGPTFEDNHYSPTTEYSIIPIIVERDRQQHMSSQWSAALRMSLKEVHDGLSIASRLPG